MDYQNLYAELMENLKDSTKNPPKLNLNSGEIEELLQLSKKKENKKEINKIFCIIDHCRWPKGGLIKTLEEVIIDNLQDAADGSSIVFTLSLMQKHFIPLKKRDGDKIPLPLVKLLGQLLTHDDLEVVEWTLRTLHLIPREAFSLRDKIEESQPKFAFFSAQKKMIKILADDLLNIFEYRSKEKE